MHSDGFDTLNQYTQCSAFDSLTLSALDVLTCNALKWTWYIEWHIAYAPEALDQIYWQSLRSIYFFSMHS